MPKRKKGEKKADFIKRCIPQLVSEGKSQSEAVAICYSLAEQKNAQLLEKYGTDSQRHLLK
jgi:hypothetical protein